MKLTAIAGIVVLFVSSGCGTVENFTEGHHNATKPYGGVRVVVDRFSGGDLVEASFKAPFWIVDVPLCAVADTVTLPVTIPIAVRRAIKDYFTETPANPPTPATAIETEKN